MKSKKRTEHPVTRFRHHANFKQSELATLLKIDQPALSRIEKRGSNISEKSINIFLSLCNKHGFELTPDEGEIINNNYDPLRYSAPKYPKGIVGQSIINKMADGKWVPYDEVLDDKEHPASYIYSLRRLGWQFETIREERGLRRRQSIRLVNYDQAIAAIEKHNGIEKPKNVDFANLLALRGITREQAAKMLMVPLSFINRIIDQGEKPSHAAVFTILAKSKLDHSIVAGIMSSVVE